jgi:hypothetical protein
MSSSTHSPKSGAPHDDSDRVSPNYEPTTPQPRTEAQPAFRYKHRTGRTAGPLHYHLVHHPHRHGPGCHAPHRGSKKRKRGSAPTGENTPASRYILPVMQGHESGDGNTLSDAQTSYNQDRTHRLREVGGEQSVYPTPALVSPRRTPLPSTPMAPSASGYAPPQSNIMLAGYQYRNDINHLPPITTIQPDQWAGIHPAAPPLIDTSPMNRRRQICAHISVIQGGIYNLQREVNLLRALMGADFEGSFGRVGC